MLASDAGHLDLDCGISHARIAAWLNDELALVQSDEGWVFSSESHTCLVKASPLESRVFGTIALERSRLMVSGEAEALAEFEKLFTLRFISAGG